MLGDFNAFLSVEDKSGGAAPNRRDMRQFGDWVFNASLEELHTVGERFTWERNMLKEKIDWVL